MWCKAERKRSFDPKRKRGSRKNKIVPRKEKDRVDSRNRINGKQICKRSWRKKEGPWRFLSCGEIETWGKEGQR